MKINKTYSKFAIRRKKLRINLIATLRNSMSSTQNPCAIYPTSSGK